MQTMFVAYLADRNIIGEAVFRNASARRFSNLLAILTSGELQRLRICSHGSTERSTATCAVCPARSKSREVPFPKLKAQHLAVLARFHGCENMATRQLRFLGYDLRYMSIGLISAVYDWFLREEVDHPFFRNRKTSRDCWTPMRGVDWSPWSADGTRSPSKIGVKPASGQPAS
jgi:hypothetical protein